MTLRRTAIVTATAAAIAIGTLAPTGAAEAAPFTPFQSASTENATNLTEVGGRRYRRYRRNRAAGAVALGIGALALGAAIAGSQQHYRRDCYIERVRVWSPRHRGYVIRKQRVCY